jgi:predicted transcriptional regulator of viral defense system
MTKLTPLHKREITKLLIAPLRYRELKPLLLSYMPKTPYKILASFEAALTRDGILHAHMFKAESGQATWIYSSVKMEDWNPYQVAQGMFPSGYFCNLTSVFFHALSNQVPSRIYVAIELDREKDRRRSESVRLSDHAIFDAFVRPHRVNRQNYKFQDSEITLTERVGRKCVGVETVSAKDRVCPHGSRVTCLERVLIDAIVNPQYNGGLGTVVDVFRKGLSHVQPGKMLDIYDKLDYVYPYWQAMGFLCDRTDHGGIGEAIAERFKPRNKFYLDHGAKTSWEFDAKWQLYYPKGIV